MPPPITKLAVQPDIPAAAQALASAIAHAREGQGAWECAVADSTLTLTVIIPRRGRRTLTLSQLDAAPTQAQLNLAGAAFGKLEVWSRAHTSTPDGIQRRTATAILY